MSNPIDKEQAIYQFWSSFDIPAYEENSVPTYEEGTGYEELSFPYITYTVSTDSIGNVVLLSGRIMFRSSSWEAADKVAAQIAESLEGHKVIKIDGGYVYLVKGSPFAQNMKDPEDASVRIKIINVLAEFLTAY